MRFRVLGLPSYHVPAMGEGRKSGVVCMAVFIVAYSQDEKGHLFEVAFGVLVDDLRFADLDGIDFHFGGQKVER